jgi:hypothetical protein
MMLPIFDLLMRLYPADFRAEFELEMRSVFVALASDRTPWTEFLALLRGALQERLRQAKTQTAVAIGGGALFALSTQMLVYRALLTHALGVCLFAGVVAAQPIPKQDPEALETAKSIYNRAFTALRDARNMDDMKKLSDILDSPDWISVDRFGRTLLTKSQADREFESLLALPPDSRVSAMDIIWAEHDAGRLIVVAWMFPREDVRAGEDGVSHRLTRATLIRDLFEKSGDRWIRIRHDKLLPNGTVLAVDGHPLAERNRVTPSK